MLGGTTNSTTLFLVPKIVGQVANLPETWLNRQVGNLPHGTQQLSATETH